MRRSASSSLIGYESTRRTRWLANSSGNTRVIARRFSTTYEIPDGHPQVVLEHAEVTGAVAHEVDAGHVDPHVPLGADPGDLAVEVAAR